MKMKTFSKIMAIALTAVMTTCMTSCEDQRDIPVYGTGVSEDSGTSVRHNLSPTAPVETEPVAPVEAFIKSAVVDYDDNVGEYITVYVVVTNNTGETHPIYYLIGVTASGFPTPGISPITYNITGDKHEDSSRKVKNGEQELCIFSYTIDSPDLQGIDVTIYAMGDEGAYGDVLDTRRFYLTEE